MNEIMNNSDVSLRKAIAHALALIDENPELSSPLVTGVRGILARASAGVASHETPTPVASVR